jgi:signal transduction histidine kinase
MVLNVEVAQRRRNERLARRAIRVADAERHNVAQETHDIVGHGLTAMLLQVGAARQVFAHDPGQAYELLASAEAIGRRACGELDVALATLGEQPAHQRGQGVADLAGLVDVLAAAGLPVMLDVDGDFHDVPTLVDWSAYRIAREALTNIARHAPGASATVTVRGEERELVLSVVDDGGPAGPVVPREEGRGIIGMRERAAALGGTLDASPRAGGGFAVVARLPW